jgi:hypothetical protein
MYIGLHVKYRYYGQILIKLEISRQFFFSKNTQIQNFMKIRPVVSELFHADGRTDRHNEANRRVRKERV